MSVDSDLFAPITNPLSVREIEAAYLWGVFGPNVVARLDECAKQATPSTATGEWKKAWDAFLAKYENEC